ncbi:BLOC-1-related complex subunit 7 isoform X2 [Nerophis ophidion]|uniref:BLOC-1-related complex subunit 7 isoform X2 n=1 Tax=Nerophis ophidion TaxID=159077 RepID=UPI002ADFBC16|nr:BLOC-1-related complex subunit 7 isoform X2 [Nerophis ophidion]
MASSETQARFGQSVKGLLSDKVAACSVDVIALTRQVLKISRSQELLGQAARNMVIQEDAIFHSEDSLRKMSIITTHLQYQQEAIQKKCAIQAPELDCGVTPAAHRPRFHFCQALHLCVCLAVRLPPPPHHGI